MLRILKIAGIPYKIRFFGDDAICPDDGERCCAYTSDRFREAGFVAGQSKEALLSDMVHEAIHRLNPKWAESKVNQLERGIAQFLIDNKLIDWDRLS